MKLLAPHDPVTLPTLTTWRSLPSRCWVAAVLLAVRHSISPGIAAYTRWSDDGKREVIEICYGFGD